MPQTQISQYKNRKVSGYMLNVDLDEANQLKIATINDKLISQFGDIILAQPGSALHITLMDWVAPLVSYEKDRDILFDEVFPASDSALSRQLENAQAFNVVFDSIHVSPAAIFIQGHDEGEFQQIRDGFLDEVSLLPGTKQPPKIVHCTIARFNREVDVEPITKFVETLSIYFNQPISAFRLVHEMEMPMLSYEVIKNYPLLSTH